MTDQLIEEFKASAELGESYGSLEIHHETVTDNEQLSSIGQFAEQISGYTGITELNFKIINQFIEKISVSEPVEIGGQIQRLTIHYKFIGALETLE